MPEASREAGDVLPWRCSPSGDIPSPPPPRHIPPPRHSPLEPPEAASSCSPSDLGHGLLEQEHREVIFSKPPSLWDIVKASQGS